MVQNVLYNSVRDRLINVNLSDKFCYYDNNHGPFFTDGVVFSIFCINYALLLGSLCENRNVAIY